MDTMAVEVAKPAQPRAARRAAVANAFLGFFIVTVLPGLFWASVFATLAPVFGYAPGFVQLLLVGGSITLFLALVFATVVFSSHGD